MKVHLHDEQFDGHPHGQPAWHFAQAFSRINSQAQP